MKKIKGGKRTGAGRKKTGRTTKVVSYSVPKKFAEELDKLVREKLSEYSKATLDSETVGTSVTYTDQKGKVRRVDPLSPEGLAVIEKANEQEIKKEIAKIREEKIPQHRDTLYGRKSWRIEQENKIKDLQRKFNPI